MWGTTEIRTRIESFNMKLKAHSKREYVKINLLRWLEAGKITEQSQGGKMSFWSIVHLYVIIYARVEPSGILNIEKYCPGLKVRFLDFYMS